MTVEDLMKPRYRVIADYPNNPHGIGKILCAKKDFSSMHMDTIEYTDEFGENVRQQNFRATSEFDKYPHLFQPLPWYSERDVKDMPEYVKVEEYFGEKKVFKIDKYFQNKFDEYYGLTIGTDTGRLYLKNACALPATELEYTAYQQSKP
jgi:hypothetical protein